MILFKKGRKELFDFCELGLGSLEASGEEHAIDGYQIFLGVAEWYSLRTPFSQWFTKNYASMFLPLAAELGLSVDGHVSYLEQVLGDIYPPSITCLFYRSDLL